MAADVHKLLLVAPDRQELINEPQIEAITGLLNSQVLVGRVNYYQLNTLCQRNSFSVIHLVGETVLDEDGNYTGFTLSGGIVLDPGQIASLGTLAGAELVFLSAPNSSLFANYLAQHGVPYVVYATANVERHRAWEMPLLFYTYVARQLVQGYDRINYVHAYAQAIASARTGNFGLAQSQDRLSPVIAETLADELSRIFKKLEEVYKILMHHEMLKPTVSMVKEPQQPTFELNSRTVIFVGALILISSLVTAAALVGMAQSILGG